MSNAFKTYVVATALVLAAVASVAGQAAKPSFAGVWAFDSAPVQPQPSGGGAVGLRPEPITIRHTADSIAIERTAFGQKTTMTFTINGQKDDTNRTGAQVWTTKTRWEGKALITTGTIAQNTSAGFDEWTFTETRSLDARGHMIVETKRVATDGSVSNGKQDWAPKK